jgi:enoyl-CoA hydratase/carnithine racemase
MSGPKTRRASDIVRKPAGGHSVRCAAGAGQARRIGRVGEIAAPSDLLAAAKAHAAAVAGNAPLAVRAATDREIAGQPWLMQTDDFARGARRR